ncbi:hypothetical protein RFI_07973 [Reticulomyxa filosa]|uniref:Uncharacterized protein n=1 Tax=Reticulomyxa filosa TaxID=46433 RepID=X6NS94_RETFI|nr:hypothetical protein RFI_07973 [Reticulomyxa filosa]|eukprot:ETO29155.1 hypothetical protein RFI_07973 [Reticulomyxa filosa]
MRKKCLLILLLPFKFNPMQTNGFSKNQILQYGLQHKIINFKVNLIFICELVKVFTLNKEKQMDQLCLCNPLMQNVFVLYCLFIVFYLRLKQLKEEDIQVIIQHWIRILNIKLGWIHEFDKIVVNYVSSFVFFFHLTTTFFMLNTFRSSSKLLKTFTGHTSYVNSIDYSTFNGDQFICSGSDDKTVRIWNVDNKKSQSFNGHSAFVYCVKFSPYHYYNHRQNVICSSSLDKTIRFWNIKHNKQLQIFNGHTGICSIKFSPFNGGRYLCSGSYDNNIHLWDVETSKSLHVFDGHKGWVLCVDISPFQSKNNNSDKSNNTGLIGGNGYTICSGSWDKTIRIWDVETTKQLNVFKGHEDWVRSVKYGSNKLVNMILSGSEDNSVRLWDIRSDRQVQVFNGHTDQVFAVEYSPFTMDNSGSSNVICSGSIDKTIRFWDIRSNKNQLYVMKVNEKILCLKFIELKENLNNNERQLNGDNCINLCYGSSNGLIRFWG